MENTLVIQKEIKIIEVKNVWNNIKKLDKPAELDFSNIENCDGAGFQLICFIVTLSNSFPSEYIIKGFSDYIKDKLNFNRIIYTKGDI